MNHDFELLLAMTEREIKARYKSAVFGFLWIILNPILQMLIIGVVFSVVLKVALVDYLLFLFIGLLLWNFFSTTLTKVTPVIVYESNLIGKAVFSRQIIVLCIILSDLFHTVVAFFVFGIFLILVQKLNMVYFLLVPLSLIWATILVTGIGFFTSALNVRYRDVSFFVQALVPLWFYATPIIYSTKLVPQQLQIFLYLNPMVGIVQLARWSIIKGEVPDFSLILFNLLITVLMFIIGFLTFRKEAPYFDDWF